LELLVAVEGRDLDRRAERGLGHRQVDGRVDVVALAHEAWVGSHVDAHVCVPCARAEDAGVPLAGEADLLAVVDAGWNLDVQPALFDDAAGALADRAWRLDAPARASARRARLRANELPEDAARDLLQAAGTATRRTGRDLAARLCAVAAAALARHRDAERNLADGAAGRLDEFDLDVGAEIRAARPHAARDEIVSEERGEEVGEVAEVEVSRLEAAAAQPGVPVAIVELAGLRLRQHLVGLDDFAEALLGIGRVGDVGMQLAREPPEGLLDLPLVRAARDAEELVIVALRRRHSIEISGRCRPTRRSGKARSRQNGRRRPPSRSPCAPDR